MVMTTAGEPAAWVQACLLKTALLGLGLHQGFTTYLDPKAPTKALLFLGGCQIIVDGDRDMSKGCCGFFKDFI